MQMATDNKIIWVQISQQILVLQRKSWYIHDQRASGQIGQVLGKLKFSPVTPSPAAAPTPLTPTSPAKRVTIWYVTMPIKIVQIPH